MTCRDDTPHSQGCPCWNAKVREDAYEECAKAVEQLAALHRKDGVIGEALAEIAQSTAGMIRRLADKHRLETGEAALRDT